jgi:cyanophycinase
MAVDFANVGNAAREDGMAASESLWPEWCSGTLRSLLTDAEEEARERGHRIVQPMHLALAMTRTPSPLWDQLRSLAVEPRRWRDLINQTVGTNIGIERAAARNEDIGRSSSPAELRYTGPLQLAPRSLKRLDITFTLAGASAAPEHLLVSLLGGVDVGAGNAKWLGLSERRLREALSLPIETRPYRRGPGCGPRPTGGGPIVLMGSCHPNPKVLHAALRAGRPSNQALVTAVFAAGDHPDERVMRAFADLGARVVDSGIYSRDSAEDGRGATQIRDADVVFLGGGFSQVLCDVLLDTPALDALVTASNSGAVVVGCSAGVSLLSVGVTESWSAPGDPPGPFPMLDWLNGMVLEPHLSPERGVQRLREAMRTFPGGCGLGIAHQGAVIVDRGWHRVRTLEAGFAPGNVLVDNPDAVTRPIGSHWISIARDARTLAR